MTFAASTTQGQETIGVRMEFLANNAAIRADALARLQGGADPIQVAQSLTDGTTVIDIFADDEDPFAAKLDTLLASGDGQAYKTRVAALHPSMRDTMDNRQHVLDFWRRVLEARPAAANDIRKVFIQALQAQGGIHVRWGQPPVTGKKPGSAEYKSGEVVMTINAGL